MAKFSSMQKHSVHTQMCLLRSLLQHTLTQLPARHHAMPVDATTSLMLWASLLLADQWRLQQQKLTLTVYPE